MLLLLLLVVVIASILETLLVKFRNSDVDFDRVARFLGVALVESIDKTLILRLETTTNR